MSQGRKTWWSDFEGDWTTNVLVQSLRWLAKRNFQFHSVFKNGSNSQVRKSNNDHFIWWKNSISEMGVSETPLGYSVRFNLLKWNGSQHDSNLFIYFSEHCMWIMTEPRCYWNQKRPLWLSHIIFGHHWTLNNGSRSKSHSKIWF